MVLLKKKKENYNVRAGKRSVLAGVRMGKVLSTMGPHTVVLFMIGFLCKVLCCAVLCLVAQSCPTLWDPMDCSLPGISVHGDL